MNVDLDVGAAVCVTLVALIRLAQMMRVDAGGKYVHDDVGVDGDVCYSWC